MTRLVLAPESATEEQTRDGNIASADLSKSIAGVYRAMIAARPPVTDEMLEVFVEPMAQTLFEQEWAAFPEFPWAKESPEAKDYWRSSARAALRKLRDMMEN